MAERPRGTVTFLFTDIEGSTKLWERYPEAMKAAVAQHDAMLKSAVEGHAGYLVKTTGDGLLAAFGIADDALTAALDAQRALSSAVWSETGPLRVRMGLHTGPAEERDGDYFGPALNRAARLMAVGHGGQVLLSMPTYELVRDHPPEGVTLRDLGERRLKDLARSEHIYQVVAPDLPAQFPPLNTLDARPNNLPVKLDPLIGRETEVAAVRDTLMRSNVGLVTLTGPGGTGKTRLALQAGAELLDEFEDGVHFVDLAPITDTALVATTIAETLDLREHGARPILDLLKRYLHDKHLLLILDNFEQINVAAPLVADLLAAAWRLKVIVTSREMLHLRGEREFAVPPLATPNPKRLPATGAELVAALSQFDAVRLFIERAVTVNPDFTVTNDNASAVAEICYRLDGLPLAIELAAARIRLLSPQALLQRLGSSLKILSGGARDLPTRQQTLRDAIAWSYDLLPEHEQRLFRQLGVFVGGFSIETAEAVCGPDGELENDIVEGVASLMDKSLVQQREGVNGEPRFAMLETIRKYALERLAEAGEVAAVRQQHAHFYLTLAETAEPELNGAEQGPWLNRLETEHDNLRAALRWGLREGDTVVGLRLASALSYFWYRRGYWSEGRAWLKAALDCPGGNTAERAKVLLHVGELEAGHGDYAAARAWYEESLVCFRALEDKAGIVSALSALGLVAREQGDAERAATLLEESLALFREQGDQLSATWALCSLGEVAVMQGDAAGATALLAEGLMGFRKQNDALGIAWVLNHLAHVAQLQRDYGRASQLHEESLLLFQQRDRLGVAWALNGLGDAALGQGDTARATARYTDSLALFQELGSKQGIAWCLAGFAGVASMGGQSLASVQRAARLWGAAEALREVIGTRPAPGVIHDYERQVAVCAQVDDGVFESSWREGRAMTLDQAVAYALESIPEAELAPRDDV